MPNQQSISIHNCTCNKVLSQIGTITESCTCQAAGEASIRWWSSLCCLTSKAARRCLNMEGFRIEITSSTKIIKINIIHSTVSQCIQEEEFQRNNNSPIGSHMEEWLIIRSTDMIRRHLRCRKASINHHHHKRRLNMEELRIHEWQLWNTLKSLSKSNLSQSLLLRNWDLRQAVAQICLKEVFYQMDRIKRQFKIHIWLKTIIKPNKWWLKLINHGQSKMYTNL